MFLCTSKSALGNPNGITTWGETRLELLNNEASVRIKQSRSSMLAKLLDAVRNSYITSSAECSSGMVVEIVWH
jgi:hypothetical protein